MLQVKDVCKQFESGVKVVSDMSFSLGRDETLAFVGPSGCGKTTLLYIVCGLMRPDSGRVLLNGAEVRGPTPDISIILQDFGLLPWKTVLDNVALGLKLQGIPKKKRLEQALIQLEAVGLSDKAKAYPKTLSGGEKQRVAIARSFASDPKLMLLDEPFSSLDALTREKLQDNLLDIWCARKIPYILVTHSLEEAVFLGSRIIVLGRNPAQAKACLDNPGFGSKDYRRRESFFAMASAIRRVLEK